MRPSRLAAIIATAVLASGCGSSPSTPIAASGSTTTTSTPTSASADSASTVASDRTSTTAPEETTTTTATTTPTPLPLDGTGVRGRVTTGPTCPVERPDQPCPPRPVQGTVTAIDHNRQTASSTTTDADGRYALGLPPGDYTLRVTPDPGPFPRCPDTPATVTAGPPTTVDVNCDTGIR